MGKQKDIWDHGSSSAEPETKRNFGSRPSVGQTKPYSGGNAHGVHEKPRRNVKGAGEAPASQPRKQTY